MATITKRLCMQVGSYGQGDKTKAEYREVGVEIEFSDARGNKWTELKFNADALHLGLLGLAKRFMDPGSSTVRIKKFDVARKTKTPDAEEGPPEDWDPEVPF